MDALPTYRALKPIKTSRDGGNDEEGQPLSPMARLFHEPGSNVYIVGILGSKTKIYPDVAKARLVNGLLKHPRFSSLQVLDEDTGEIKWVATEVNLDDHVVVPEVESNIESSDKFVEDYISNLTKPNLDKSKPLWDLHLLNIKTSESEGVFVYRVHHSIGDGMSIMSLLLACSRKVSDPMALPTIPEMKKSSLMKKIGFWSALQLIWNTVVGVFLFVGTTLFLKDTETPIKGPPGVENNPRRVIKLTTSLDDVKLVKNAMNATINDVVLGVTQAGLSRYLNRRYEDGFAILFNNMCNQIKCRTQYCGHELAYYAPTCCGQPNALMIHVISYTNKLIFVISADEGTIPDPHQLSGDLEESLKLIKAAVLARQQINGLARL